MAGRDRPEWYSIAYLIFVAFCIALMSFINSFLEHKRPSKPYIERSYKSTYSKKSVVEIEENQEEKDSIKSEKKIEDNIQEPKVDQEPLVDAELKNSQSDDIYFSELIKNYKISVLSKLERPDSRTDVVVRYYSKPKDKGMVYGLSKYGFYIHERSSDDLYKNFATNALYFGDDVKNEDIQLVSYLLLEAGVELKKILPSKLHDDWKSNAIEIGTDTLFLKLPTLKLKEIRKNWN
jgi:hypothetical protein